MLLLALSVASLITHLLAIIPSSKTCIISLPILSAYVEALPHDPSSSEFVDDDYDHCGKERYPFEAGVVST